MSQRGGAALSRMRRRGQQRTADPAGRQPAAVVAYDEMWTYQLARHGDKRQDLWIWTAIVEEPDGRRWADFEVGDRSENTFQKLYARLPDADLHRSDAYGVYQSWLPPDRHVVGKGRGELERGALIDISIGVAAEQAEPAGAADERVHQKRRDAGLFGGLAAGGLGLKTQCQFMLRISPYRGH